MKLKYVFAFLVVVFIKFNVFDASSKSDTPEVRCMKDYGAFLTGDYMDRMKELLDIQLNLSDYTINQILANFDSIIALQNSQDLSECPVKLQNTAETIHSIFNDKANMVRRIQSGELTSIDPDAAYYEQEKLKKAMVELGQVYDEYF